MDRNVMIKSVVAMAMIKEIVMANTLLTFFLVKKLTNGFNTMAIIVE
jgi:hypothetical protein